MAKKEREERVSPEREEARPIERTVIGSDEYLVSVPSADRELEKLPLEKIIEIAEKDAALLKRVRVISIGMTSENDWIDQNGKPYLMEDGAEAIANLWGIDHFDIKVEKELAEDEQGKYYIYTAFGKFYSKRLKRYIEQIGTCSQRDLFFGTERGKFLPLTEIDETSVKKAAVTNLFCRGIKTCAGMKNITYDEIKAAGLDMNKISKIEYGKGAKKVEKALSKVALEQKKEIWDLCLKMGGDEKAASFVLKQLTYFEDTQGNKHSINDIKKLTSEKWIASTYKKAQSRYKKHMSEGEQPPLEGTDEQKAS